MNFKPLPLPPDPNITLGLNEAVRAWIKAKLADGTFDCAYSVMPSATNYYGMGILNAASLEAAYQTLTTYPGFLANDFEVYPLIEVFGTLDNVNAAVRQTMGG